MIVCMKNISKIFVISALFIVTSCVHMPQSTMSKTDNSITTLSKTDTPPQAKTVLQRYLSASGKHCARYLNFDNIIETACLNTDHTAWERLTLFERES